MTLSRIPALHPIQNTSAVLIAQNPVLEYGRIAMETDTNRVKSGDGVSTYTQLTYVEWNYEIVEAAGTDTYTGNFSKPFFLAYFPMMRIRVRFTNANTGAATINLNGLGAIAIRKNVSTALVAGDILAGGIYELSYDGTNFQLLTVAGNSAGVVPAALTRVDDTNVTLTLGGTPATALLKAVSLTLGWIGQLSLARGGTNANLTASNGGIFYSTATAGAILSGTATAGQMLRSGASAAPTWSTNVWPNTTGSGQILYATSANTIGSATDFLRLSTGELLVGYTASNNALYGIQTYKSASNSGILIGCYSTTDTETAVLTLLKSSSATLGTGAATASGELLGTFAVAGYNSSNTIAQPISISFFQDGAAGASFIPGRIELSTGTAAGARTLAMLITSGGSVVIGDKVAALATNATDGFLYIPTCAGTPTGVPTAQTGTVAMIFDTTNNKLYIYDGGWLGGTTPGAFT